MLTFLQDLFAGIVQAALNLASALIKGILLAPFTALRRAAPIEVRPGRPDEVEALRARLGATPPPTDGTLRHWVAVRDGEVLAAATLRDGDEPVFLGAAEPELRAALEQAVAAEGPRG